MHIFDTFHVFFEQQFHTRLLKAAGILLIGILLLRLISVLLNLILKSLSQQHRFVIRKVTMYILDALLGVFILSYLGVDLTAILGTVGILSIIVGIASQSAIGNIISGIFLLSEGAFQIGDMIRIETHTGVVHSIDLLSIRLRTFDNVLMRIPNQMLLNTKFVNLSKFPYRRLDIEVTISHDSDLKLVEPTFRQIVRSTPGCLVSPEPLITFKEFSSQGVILFFGVWFEQANFLKVKNGLFVRIQEQFREVGLHIAHSRIEVVHADSFPPVASTENNTKA